MRFRMSVAAVAAALTAASPAAADPAVKEVYDSCTTNAYGLACYQQTSVIHTHTTVPEDSKVSLNMKVTSTLTGTGAYADCTTVYTVNHHSHFLVKRGTPHVELHNSRYTQDYDCAERQIPDLHCKVTLKSALVNGEVRHERSTFDCEDPQA